MTEIEKRLATVENLVKEHHNMLTDYSAPDGYRNHPTTAIRMQNLQLEFEKMISIVSQCMSRLNAFELDERFAEIFTDEDIQNLYKMSGVSTTEVAKWFKDITGKDVSDAMITKYTQGEFKDVILRSRFGRWLRLNAKK
jgi:hypothetical protein